MLRVQRTIWNKKRTQTCKALWFGNGIKLYCLLSFIQFFLSFSILLFDWLVNCFALFALFFIFFIFCLILFILKSDGMHSREISDAEHYYLTMCMLVVWINKFFQAREKNLLITSDVSCLHLKKLRAETVVSSNFIITSLMTYSGT